MKRIELSKIASWLYHKNENQATRMEIYKAQGNSFHSLCEIKHDFSQEHEEVIQRVQREIKEAENKRILELKKLKIRKR